ncbi:MAG: YidC/Oxa1 family membrane protein insertase [Clostridia bacterium]
MISFFANIFGYVLNIIYELVKNYGLAIILFSILLKLLLLPMTIKQQKTLKKSQKVQVKLKEIQDKYSNNPEKLNQEMMDLYKRENLSPFSGCLSSIIQIILLFAMFYLVRSPLTYMKKISVDEINKYKEQIVLEQGENSVSATYPEISIIKYINNKEQNQKEEIEEQKNNIENLEENNIQNVVEEENKVEDNIEINEDLYINMNFLGMDLSSVPKENYKDIKVFIIPLLYIISSFISIKMTQVQQPKNDNNKKEENQEPDMTAQMNKSMLWMMPILAVSVSLVAPLGLALYWLVNNILMIIERVVIDKFIVPKEEENND